MVKDTTLKKGLFITFEGPDGSGKTTQIQSLKSYFERKGLDAVLTREPGGTPIGEKIREIILDRENAEMDSMTEALLYAAARAQHVAQVIRPALEEGKMVICDRFVDSSIAYQGYGRKLGEQVEVINQIAAAGCLPDATFLMKIAPAEGKDRIKDEVLDRLEMEKLEYHEEVFRGYLEIEKQYPDRVIGIDATKSVEAISAKICSYMDTLLETR